jgi:hypothetical protein
MHIRKGLTIAALSALAPAVSSAWPAKQSLDACVSAFEKSLETPDASGRTYKVVYNDDQSTSSVTRYFSSASYTFELQANNPRTGEVLARARCLANSRGVVSSLSPLPLPAASEGRERVAQSPSRTAQN